MTTSPYTHEQGELRMLSLTWSRESFLAPMRVWTEATSQLVPWRFLPSMDALFRPTEVFENALAFTQAVLAQQGEFARALLGPRGQRQELPEAEARASGSEAGPEEARELGGGTAARLRELERERDEALASRAAAEEALAAARAERDRALQALRAAEAEARKPGAEAEKPGEE